MPIRGIGKMKLDTLKKNLADLERELKEWDVVNKKGIVGTTNHVLPLKIAKDIAEYEKQIEKLKAKKTGGRRTRSTRGRGTRRHTRRGRGGNPSRFPPLQTNPYKKYDEHLSAAQAKEDKANADATREKYEKQAKQPYSPIAVGHSVYTPYRLRVAATRRNAKL